LPAHTAWRRSTPMIVYYTELHNLINCQTAQAEARCLWKICMSASCSAAVGCHMKSQTKKAHAKLHGSTCLMIKRMHWYTAFGVSTQLPRMHTMQNLVELYPLCPHCKAQAGRLSALDMFCPLNACSFWSRLLSTATCNTLKPHIVLFRACGYTQQLCRLQSAQMTV